jgi:hypothetical protein
MRTPCSHLPWTPESAGKVCLWCQDRKRDDMTKKLNMKRLATLLLAALLIWAGTLQPAHAAPKPYHIKNAPSSSADLEAFAVHDTPCDYRGSIAQLFPGQEADSLGWDWFRPVAGSGAFTVDVYNGTTGAHIVKRYYPSRQCVQAYNANDYYVYILF